MSGRAKVSVVLTTYNRVDFCRECLYSIEQQAPIRADEIILVDDGSTDGTLEILRTEFPQVQTIRQKNAGPGAARNAGARAASNPYVAFVDSDDLWPSNTLRAVRRALEKHEDIALLFLSYIDFGETENLPPPDLSSHPKIEVFENYFETSSRAIYAGAGMMVVRRSDFLDVGGFSELRINAEDHDLAMRLGDRSEFGVISSPALIYHRMHDSNEMSLLGQNVIGVQRLVDNEVAGKYPGGPTWRNHRRTIISRHVRSVSAGLIRTGNLDVAKSVVRKTIFWWQQPKQLAIFAYICLRLAFHNVATKS